MSRKVVNKEHKVKSIAQAALGLFAQRGYAATRVEQIADSAGVGKGTIYEYFGTKADIFVAAIMQWMVDVQARTTTLLEGVADPVQRIHIVAQMSADLCDPEDAEKRRLFFEVVQQTVQENGAFFKRKYMVKEMSAGRCQMVVDMLLEGVSQGLFRPEIARDVDKIATNLMAYLDGLVWHSMISSNVTNFKHQIDFYLDSLIRSIRSEAGRSRQPDPSTGSAAANTGHPVSETP